MKRVSCQFLTSGGWFLFVKRKRPVGIEPTTRDVHTGSTVSYFTIVLRDKNMPGSKLRPPLEIFSFRSILKTFPELELKLLRSELPTVKIINPI